MVVWGASPHRKVGRERGLENMAAQAAWNIRREAAEEGQTQGGGLNQSNNHSKLTDSNNCLLFFSSCRLIAFVSTPLLPVSSSVRLRRCRCYATRRMLTK